MTFALIILFFLGFATVSEDQTKAEGWAVVEPLVVENNEQN